LSEGSESALEGGVEGCEEREEKGGGIGARREVGGPFGWWESRCLAEEGERRVGGER